MTEDDWATLFITEQQMQGRAVPMIGNLHMAHVWSVDDVGGACKRCGVLWPDKDNCP